MADTPKGFTKEKADAAIECVEALFNAIPKARRLEYIGEYNDAMLFLERAKVAAPAETKAEAEPAKTA